MIDYTKPIEYIDGSPAHYLGRNPINNEHVVTPRGRPQARSGNFYADNGDHISNAYMSIRNVDPIEAAIGRHPVDRKRMAVRKTSGRAALTEYWLEQRFGPPLRSLASTRSTLIVALVSMSFSSRPAGCTCCAAAAAAAALKEAEPVIARTAQKGLMHRKSASRKVSRLAKRVSAMGKA